MDRLLTHVRSRALLFLSPTRSLSSIKINSFDFKSHALLNLYASKPKSSNENNSLFPLPGLVGFSHEIKSIPKSLLIDNNIEIHTYDCSTSLRFELQNLFLNYNTLTQPLTAITVIFKTNSDMSTWSIEVENERHQLTEEFIKLAHEISNYLNAKQYWVDFIDPSNGKPYYGPSTSDTLFETDERFRNFGIDIVDLGCCRVIEHLQYGTHVFVGCIFTNAPNVQHLLKEFPVPNCSK